MKAVRRLKIHRKIVGEKIMWQRLIWNGIEAITNQVIIHSYREPMKEQN